MGARPRYSRRPLLLCARGATRSLLAFLSLATACGPREVADGSPPKEASQERPAIFIDRAADLGLDFRHVNGMSGQLYFFEPVGSGAALFDYDNDGDLDVYLVQGSAIGHTPADATSSSRSSESPPRDRLYRNDLTLGADGSRDLAFIDVTAASGLDARGYGMGVAVGDYDNDGWPDLYVTNFGPNQMWRNNGDGTFTETTATTATASDRWDTSTTFLDFDRDGWLDLLVTRYVDYRPESEHACRSPSGRPDYCGPLPFDGVTDLLLRNRGRGANGRVSFADVTATAGLGGAASSGLGVVSADFDRDGWPDLYVANDLRRNFLWMGQVGGRRFENRAMIAGAAVRGDGRAEASMGISAGDVDNDGDIDLFLTHLMSGTNTLYLNDGDANFTDRTTAAGLDVVSLRYTGFGTAFVDYDNDGWLDLAVVNGSVNRIEALVRAGDPFPLGQGNQLFRNLGESAGPRFAEVSDRAGESFSRLEVSRGLATGDVDNDGDIDLLVINNHGPARLLINLVGQDRPWLGARLVTAGAPRDALGANAVLQRIGGPALHRQVQTGSSYCSASDPRLLFGLGDGSRIDRLQVEWPSGRRETWSSLAIGRYHTLVEGTGSALSEGSGQPAQEPVE